MDIRQNIKKLVSDEGLSVRQLSIKSGVRRQSIMHFLAGGNIHLDNLEKILISLGHELTVSDTPPKAKKFSIKDRLFIQPKIVQKFCRDNGIKFLAVFGSVLRDDFQKNSDIDILIEFDKPISFFEFADIENKLKTLFKTKHKLDVVTKKSLSPLIAEEVSKSNEVLYEKAA